MTPTPLTNRGVPAIPHPKFSIDWLRWTVRDKAEFPRFMKHFSYVLDGEVASIERPFPFYDMACKMNLGRVDWNTEKPEQGVLFTLTGSDLVEWLRAGGDHQELIDYICTLPAMNVARLDFAVDIYDPAADPNAFYRALQAGTVKTSARSTSRVESTVNGEKVGVTVYIGSRYSARLLRVYDKAVQTGSDFHWVRVELELKKEFATLLARQMSERGIVPAGKAAMRDFVGTGFDWFESALLGPNVDYITPGKRKETKWTKWVKEVVVPNAIKAIAQDVPGFRDAMREALRLADISSEHGNPQTE